MLIMMMMMMMMMMLMLLIPPCTFWPAGPLLGVSPLNYINQHVYSKYIYMLHKLRLQGNLAVRRNIFRTMQFAKKTAMRNRAKAQKAACSATGIA